MQPATFVRVRPLLRSLVLVPFIAAAPAWAATAWSEAAQGDLSSDGLAPTALSFVAGANTIIGSMGNGDLDYFRFSVPVGSRLSAIQVNAATQVSGGQSFFAIQVGPQVTVTPTGGGTGPGSLLAFDHYDSTDIGTNLLARLLPNSPGIAAGTYSVWLNETGGSTPYSFDFVLSAVPEPGAAALFGLGLGALLVRRLRAEKSSTQG